MLASTRTRHPSPAGAKLTSMFTSSSELRQASRLPGSHAVIRPSSSASSSYTSSSRPPTPGSHRMATVRPPAKWLIGPRTHHRSSSSVNAANAVSGSTATSTSDDTMVSCPDPLIGRPPVRHGP